MFTAFFAFVLSVQAAEHNAGKCQCNEAVVTSYTAIVQGPNDAWGGQAPYVRYVPDRVEFRPCPHARRMRVGHPLINAEIPQRDRWIPVSW